jgi:hypothetical protein
VKRDTNGIQGAPTTMDGPGIVKQVEEKAIEGTTMKIVGGEQQIGHRHIRDLECKKGITRTVAIPITPTASPGFKAGHTGE